MNTAINNHDYVRVWKDGSCTMLETNGSDPYDTLIMHKDHADSVYNKWAASDTDLSYFHYAKELAAGRNPDKALCGLTAEDQAIFARLWIKGGTPPFVLIEGDHRDATIMATLSEMTEQIGVGTCAEALNVMEEQSYVYWIGQCSPDYDFAPHYYT